MGGLWPLTSGGRLRSFHIIRALSEHHDLTVLTTHTSDEDGAALAAQLPRCEVQSFLFAPPKHASRAFIPTLAASWFGALPVDLYKYRCHSLRLHAERLLEQTFFDACIADFLTAVPNTPLGSTTPVILFSHNVEYMIWQRLHDHETSLVKRILLAIEVRKMRRYEAFACDQVTATIAVSAEDARVLTAQCPQAKISAVPTGVDVDYFKPDAVDKTVENALVFSGSMDWQPNEDAMLYFMREILPLIRAALPTTTLSIVGRNPSALLRKEAALADVAVTGTVPDIRPWLAEASVYVVPLRIGGGTRLKIFEALAMGKAVVSTTIGSEGLELLAGVHLSHADTARRFADEVISLLKNHDQRRAMGLTGRRLMERYYGWDVVAQHFEDLCRCALAGAPLVSIRHSSSGKLHTNSLKQHYWE